MAAPPATPGAPTSPAPGAEAPATLDSLELWPALPQVLQPLHPLELWPALPQVLKPLHPLQSLELRPSLPAWIVSILFIINCHDNEIKCLYCIYSFGSVKKTLLKNWFGRST